MLGRLACATIAIFAIVLAACVDGDSTPALESPAFETAVTSSSVIQSRPTAPAPGQPPFENLGQLVDLADLAVIARVEDVSPLEELAGRAVGTVWYQDSTAVVERLIFGPQLETLTIRNALYAGPDIEHRMPTRAPTFKPGERTLVFLTSRSGFFDLRGPVYETVGGGVLWGKFAMGDGTVSGLSPVTDPRPLEAVESWIREARDQLAIPGLIGGIVSGLDPGTRVTLRLVRMDASELTEAETLATWKAGNGPWERGGLKLRAGSYGLVAEAAGYLPMTARHMFSVPDELIAWRYRDFNVEMFQPRDALVRFGLPLCQPHGAPSPEPTVRPSGEPTVTPLVPIQPGTSGGACYGGYLGRSPHIQRGIAGYVSLLPDGVTATVRIQRLPRDPRVQYVGGPFSPNLTYPEELSPVEDLVAFEPIEPVATIEVEGGRWGLVDPSLGGEPYLVTLAVPGHEVRPVGYQVVVLGGKVPHLVRGVDFAVRAPSQSSSEPPTVPPTPDLTALSSVRTSATPTPTQPGADAGAVRSDIVFEMKDRYPLGEPVEIGIRNQSATATYFYQRFYSACYNLKFFDSSSESRPYPQVNPSRPPPLMLPGQFIVPKGTHCDLINELPLKPGEAVLLFTWDQDVCVKDNWGCVESNQVGPGEYRILGEFAQDRGVIVPGETREGVRIAVGEWKFVIEPRGE